MGLSVCDEFMVLGLSTELELVYSEAVKPWRSELNKYQLQQIAYR